MFLNCSHLRIRTGILYHRAFSNIRSSVKHERIGTKGLFSVARNSLFSLLRRPKSLKLFRKTERMQSWERMRKNSTEPYKRNNPNKLPEPGMEWPIIFFTLAGIYLIYKNVSRAKITWEEFVKEILTQGDVEKIILWTDTGTMQVHVRSDAAFRQKHGNSLIYYLHVPDVQMAEEDIRDIENELRIAPSDAVEIIHQTPINLTSLLLLIPLLIGLRLFKFGKSMNLKDLVNLPFTKASYTLIDPLAGGTKGIRFSDVAGLREAKQEVMEFVDYLKTPERYKALGAKIPKGALLLGPPGCGKTLLAKAVATEAIVPFLSMNGTEFIEVVGGLGASRMRALFKDARNFSPCIIYIDEIDAIGRKRSSTTGRHSYGNSEEDQTLNQLLVEMDGVASREGVVVLASTNRAEVLDAALLRPGRFDRHIMIDLPTAEERREIFIQHLKGLKLEHKPEYYARRMATLTPGLSGADIANICNEAALHAARFKKSVVKGEDLEYAVERVTGGAEKRSGAMSLEDKRVVAYHETGRALIGWLSERGEILLKISIVPRTNQSAGWTHVMVTEQYLLTQEELFEKMCMALGGRAAETLIFNKVSTKSEKDLQKVTRIAYAQIVQYGMSEILGPISFSSGDSREKFLGKPYSRQLAAVIDGEVRQLVAKAFRQAEDILRSNKRLLVKLAEELLKRETMNFDEVKELIGPPKNRNPRAVEPLVFDMSIDMAAGPDPGNGS